MAAPTSVASYSSGYAVGTSITVSGVTADVGDLLVCKASAENATYSIAAPTGGTGLTWTLQASPNAGGGGGVSPAWIWTAPVTVALSAVTLTLTVTGGSAWCGAVVRRWSGSDGVGAVNSAAGSGAPTVSLTTTGPDSGVDLIAVDWNAVDGASRAWTPSGQTEVTYVRDAAIGTAYGAFWVHPGAYPASTTYPSPGTYPGAAGTVSYGLTAPTGQEYAIAALEILGTTALTLPVTEPFTGANGDPWPAARWVAALTGTGGAAEIQSNAGRLASGTAGGYSGAARVSRTLDIAAIADVEISGTWTPDANEPYASAVVRGDATLNTETGYYLALNKTGTLDLLRKVAFASTVLGSITFAASSNTTYGFRLRAQGTSIRARVWSGAEPSTWQIDVTDSGVPGAGAVGVNVGAGDAAVQHAVAFDDVVISAPTDPGGGGSALSATITDPVGLADAVTRALSLARTVDDPIGVLDAVTAAFGQAVSITDSLGLVDSLASALALARTVDDTAGLVDTVVRALTLARTVDDTAGLTDAVAAALTIARTVTDSTGLADLLTAAFGVAAVIDDPIGLADTLTRVLALARTITDDAGLVDVVVAAVAAARTVTDSVGLVDALTAAFGQIATITDPVGLTDSLTRAVAAIRTVDDPTGLTDAVTTALAIARTTTDAVGLSDILAIALGQIATITDPVGLADALSTVIGYARAVTDDAGLADILARVVGYGPGTTDGAGLSDTVTAALDMARVVVDVVGMSDTVIAVLTGPGGPPRPPRATAGTRWPPGATARPMGGHGVTSGRTAPPHITGGEG